MAILINGRIFLWSFAGSELLSALSEPFTPFQWFDGLTYIEYASTQITNIGSETTCKINCVMALSLGKPICEFYLYDSLAGICHMGTMDNNQASPVGSPVIAQTFYIQTCKFMFTHEKQLKSLPVVFCCFVICCCGR